MSYGLLAFAAATVAALSGLAWWMSRSATRLVRERALIQRLLAESGDLLASDRVQRNVAAGKQTVEHLVHSAAGPHAGTTVTRDASVAHDNTQSFSKSARGTGVADHEISTQPLDLLMARAVQSARPGLGELVPLETLVSQLPGALAIFDTEMRYLAASQRWRDDYDLGARPLVGLSHYEVFPEISPRWRNIHRRALAGEVVSEEADRFERQDGSEQWLRWQVAPWRDASGRIGGITITSEDISARKREEALVHLDQNRYRSLMDQSADPVFVHDGTGRIVEVSKRACESLGYTREELLAMNVLDLEQEFDLARAQAVWEMARDGEVLTAHGRHRRKDGSTFPVEVRFGILEINGQTLYMGAVRDTTDRERAEQALRDSEQRYRTMFQTSPDSVTITRRPDGLYLEVNDGFTRMFGWAAEEVIGRTSIQLGVWRDLDDRKKLFDQLDRSGYCENFETTFLTKERQEIAVLLSSRVISINGESCILTLTHDITSRKAAETQLRKLSQAVEQSPESIIIANVAGQIEYVNEAFCRRSGYSSAETLGRTADFLNAGGGRSDTARDLWVSLEKGEPWRGEFHNRRKDGSEYTEFAIVAPIRRDDGKVTHVVAVQQDITDRLQAERKIQQLAYYDQLTGLPNRTLFADRLKQTVSTCARLGAHGVLMMIDLDDFKQLNDTFGHDMGDELLKQVAGRVRACVRRGDTLARLGGDEFMLVMAGLSGNAKDAAHYAQLVAQKILTSFRREFPLSAGMHYCTASIGIALFTSDVISTDELMKQADLALYQAKAHGRDAACFFDPHMESTARQRSALERDLRQSLEEHQFLLHYQPQVDGAGRIIGVEALVRWLHPVRGMVSPADFIPIAEASGLILPLGQEIFAMVLAQLVRWSERSAMAPLTVAVNVSARQIRQPDFVEQVLHAVRVSGADPATLKLEITESLLIENTEAIITKMETLKAHGVGCALDDFGIGYSSLSYLKRLPLDQMKIDQSFVRDVLTDSNDAAIARTIIGLAGNLGLAVIAEGVETEAQREFLVGAGCRAFQGYLFSRPLTPEALEEFVERRGLAPSH